MTHNLHTHEFDVLNDKTGKVSERKHLSYIREQTELNNHRPPDDRAITLEIDYSCLNF